MTGSAPSSLPAVAPDWPSSLTAVGRSLGAPAQDKQYYVNMYLSAAIWATYMIFLSLWLAGSHPGAPLLLLMQDLTLKHKILKR